MSGSSRRGVSLAIVLAVVAGMALVTSAVLPALLTHSRAAGDALDSAIALQAAEAGLRLELYRLRAGAPTDAWNPNDPHSGLRRELPDGSGCFFRAGVLRDAGGRPQSVESEGQCGAVRRRLEFRLAPGTAGAWREIR